MAPAKLLEQLDRRRWLYQVYIDRAATRLHGALADQLGARAGGPRAARDAPPPRAFLGPFRTWLAITDVLRFGLPGLVRRFFNDAPQGDLTPVEPLSIRSGSTAADLLRNEADVVQSLLYARGLPIDRWRTVTAHADGSRLMADIATTLETRWAAAASAGAVAPSCG